MNPCFCFQLPTGLEFIHALDFFIKMHKLFRLPYHPKIKNLMYFLEYFAYGIDEAKQLLAQKYQDIGVNIFGTPNAI